MITKPVPKFIQITANADHIFGLTEDGEVFFREAPTKSYTTYSHHNNYGADDKKKAEETAAKKAWKKCAMYYCIELPKGGPEREAQSNEPTEETAATTEQAAEVEVDEPPRRIYKDIDTVKSVQSALKAKGFYKENYKIDGDLGRFTVDAIKAYQKSINLRETGEIDFTLWSSLDLDKANTDEITIEVADTDLVNVEENNEVFVGA